MRLLYESIMAYKHTNSRGTDYYLHRTEVTLRGSGKKQALYYFGKQATDKAIDEVPSGYEVIEAKKTGLPILKKA